MSASVALRENFVRTLGPSPFSRFARKAYYRSYSRRGRRWWAPSAGWLPVGLTVTAERRHACEDAVQTVAAGRFKTAQLLMEVPFVAKQATAEKRQRRERGSINPDDIIKGAFELAEEVGIDNLSMPLLGKHLGVGVTSIYWYFRKKDDLLNAMTDRALRQYVFATPYVEAKDWRETLRNHARTMRKTFIGNPILCDLILIRSALSPRAAKLGVQEVEKAIASLVEAGLSADDAFDTYSAVSVHVRGSVVLQRLRDKNRAADEGPSDIEETMTIDPETTPLLAQVTARGHHIGAADEKNFEFGLECILDHANRLIDEADKRPAKAARKATKASSPRTRSKAAA